MMLEDIFVDSSAWIALADKDDSHHKEAASGYPSIFKNRKNLITSNLVIAETYIVLLKELRHEAAIEFLERIKASPRILKICSNEDIETEAEGILAKYIDQDFSYADAVSFVIMKRQKIRKAFCFDKHFVTAGFINVP
ncbi:MAG TPA: PIN domain-containing protein [Thermodesulfobacteriota bacterium]|jgi:predicted nucleic acid-binding protein|nr:PIN domain-containing protein [Thermodesulfobacteriota bacterium]